MKNIKAILITVISLSLISNKFAFAQQPGNDLMKQMLDYSRPGSNHSLLSPLVGTWRYQDARLAFVKGTLTRTPFYDGRFYKVDITGGKLKLPIADGQMKEDNYQSTQIEGFDNPKGKFVTISFNNHIGSDIQFQTGTYSVAQKEFTYDWDSELVKGMPKKNRRVVKIVDATHYTETYYEEQAGAYTKVRELDYTKVE